MICINKNTHYVRLASLSSLWEHNGILINTNVDVRFASLRSVPKGNVICCFIFLYIMKPSI